MPRDPRPIDNAIDIITPENIAFSYRVAGPFRRLPAYLIDLLLQAMILAGLQGVLLFLSIIGLLVGSFSVFMFGQFVFLLILFGIHWFYGGIFETFWNGQTPGKWLLGLRTLTIDGQPINGLQAVMRNILRLVDMMPLLSLEVFGIPSPAYIIPTMVAGLAAMTFTPRYQRLGDLVCGTMVVVEDRFWLRGVARLDDPRAIQLAGYLPADLEVSRTLARTLSTYVERRQYFAPSRRREIARHLGEPLLKRFGLRADTSHDLLLCAVYYRVFIADRRDDEKHEQAVKQTPFGPVGAMGPR
ncbi:MAG: RDD family protein [Planctomycetales bacterium]|nr:RDD family protein [Planctomycetales bacterium]